ncbi:neuroligin-3-like isoform X2 [Palaemon carinicauda]
MIAYPVVVFIHGESYEWGSSSIYDGSVLAALGKVIVVTINYRLGILGFFNPNVDPVGRATVANYGLMDQLAALHWVQENIVRFGGDPGQVTVMGHGTGAACLNFLVVSPAATGAGLFKRAILMSGSALSPWAIVHEPVHYAVETATQLGCQVPEDLYHNSEKLLHCLRDKSVDQILEVQLETPQFLVAIGPSVDGVTIKPDWKHQQSKMGKERRTPVDLLLGITTANFLEIFNENELQHGFESEHRDRLLRTFVRNNYRFHLQEIMLAISSEYTDWSRAVQHPISIRDMTGEALHDANIVSPMLVLARQLCTASRTTYLYVLDHREENHYSDRHHRKLVNELAYVFGHPLGALGAIGANTNFTVVDMALSESVINMWANFVKFGHPNDLSSSSVEMFGGHKGSHRTPEWPRFDPVQRKYLVLGNRRRIRDHYRAGRVAFWSWLIPGLERVGSRYGTESSLQRLPNLSQSDTFSGPTRPSNLSSNLLPPPTIPSPSLSSNESSHHQTGMEKIDQSQEAILSSNSQGAGQLQKDFPYRTALSVTVAIGCSLLILNLLVFAAVYYRYDASRQGFTKGSHDTSSDSGNDVQLHSASDACKAVYTQVHYGTLPSSATLRSSLATFIEGDPQIECPPDYASSCQSGDEEITQEPLNKKKNHIEIIGRTLLQPQNGNSVNRSATLVLKQPVASYTSPIDGELMSANYSSDNTSDMQV